MVYLGFTDDELVLIESALNYQVERCRARSEETDRSPAPRPDEESRFEAAARAIRTDPYSDRRRISAEEFATAAEAVLIARDAARRDAAFYKSGGTRLAAAKAGRLSTIADRYDALAPKAAAIAAAAAQQSGKRS